MRTAAPEKGGGEESAANSKGNYGVKLRIVCPYCQGEEEKQQRDEARILSPDPPQQT